MVVLVIFKIGIWLHMRLNMRLHVRYFQSRNLVAYEVAYGCISDFQNFKKCFI